MSETKASKSLINKLPAEVSQIAIPYLPQQLPIASQDKRENLITWQPCFASDANDTSLLFYYQRWMQEIYNRFHESKKRFPEFFPCFELKYNSEGLLYSIHFKPLTQHSEALAHNAPLFPTHEEFKPIKQLWSEDGQSELELVFERFPTQLALNPPKEPWGARWRRLFLELVNQGLELKHIGSLLVRKNA